MENSIPLSSRLIMARDNMKWTQSQLAHAAGLQPAAISHFETGERLPSVRNLIRLSKALQVPTDWLLGLTKNKPIRQVVIDGINYYPKPQ